MNPCGSEDVRAALHAFLGDTSDAGARRLVEHAQHAVEHPVRVAPRTSRQTNHTSWRV